MRKFLIFTASAAVIFVTLSAVVWLTDPLAWLLGPLMLAAIPVGLGWGLSAIVKRA
jgi:hypothetical protein